jgi:hypothetical protein
VNRSAVMLFRNFKCVRTVAPPMPTAALGTTVRSLHLTVVSFLPTSVVIDRTDTDASVSAGLTAVYTGRISAAGNSIVNGQGHLTWAGSGTWAATTTACANGNDITSTTVVHVPGTRDSRNNLGVGESVSLSSGA